VQDIGRWVDELAGADELACRARDLPDALGGELEIAFSCILASLGPFRLSCDVEPFWSTFEPWNGIEVGGLDERTVAY
jgi:hypothetical protein